MTQAFDALAAHLGAPQTPLDLIRKALRLDSAALVVGLCKTFDDSLDPTAVLQLMLGNRCASTELDRLACALLDRGADPATATYPIAGSHGQGNALGAALLGHWPLLSKRLLADPRAPLWTEVPITSGATSTVPVLHGLVRTEHWEGVKAWLALGGMPGPDSQGRWPWEHIDPTRMNGYHSIPKTIDLLQTHGLLPSSAQQLEEGLARQIGGRINRPTPTKTNEAREWREALALACKNIGVESSISDLQLDESIASLLRAKYASNGISTPPIKVNPAAFLFCTRAPLDTWVTPRPVGRRTWTLLHAAAYAQALQGPRVASWQKDRTNFAVELPLLERVAELAPTDPLWDLPLEDRVPVTLRGWRALAHVEPLAWGASPAPPQFNATSTARVPEWPGFGADVRQDDLGSLIQAARLITAQGAADRGEQLAHLVWGLTVATPSTPAPRADDNAAVIEWRAWTDRAAAVPLKERLKWAHAWLQAGVVPLSHQWEPLCQFLIEAQQRQPLQPLSQKGAKAFRDAFQGTFNATIGPQDTRSPYQTLLLTHPHGAVLSTALLNWMGLPHAVPGGPKDTPGGVRLAGLWALQAGFPDTAAKDPQITPVQAGCYAVMHALALPPIDGKSALSAPVQAEMSATPAADRLAWSTHVFNRSRRAPYTWQAVWELMNTVAHAQQPVTTVEPPVFWQLWDRLFGASKTAFVEGYGKAVIATGQDPLRSMATFGWAPEGTVGEELAHQAIGEVPGLEGALLAIEHAEHILKQAPTRTEITARPRSPGSRRA